jgi:hypothetical protein
MKVICVEEHERYSIKLTVFLDKFGSLVTGYFQAFASSGTSLGCFATLEKARDMILQHSKETVLVRDRSQ